MYALNAANQNRTERTERIYKRSVENERQEEGDAAKAH